MQMWTLVDVRFGGGEGNLRKRLRSFELRMTVKKAVKGLLLCSFGKRSRSFGKGLGLA